MINCPLERIAEVPGTHDPWWFCPQCGWIYYGEKAPRRNCPKARESMIAEIDRLLELPGATGDSSASEENVAIDRLTERLTYWELRQSKRGGCGKGKAK